jgi:acyl-CoA dehydrogenase
VLPKLSDTEREALAAGDTWWDADLFTGNPDWAKLRQVPRATLSDEERAFLDGPVETLCSMVDDWTINWELGDLPPGVWAFLKEQRFFAMIIPKAFGGLAFSAYATSEVVRTIASRSSVAAVTVMVPKSLGPGELLIHFGTNAQQEYWLPRLADGREISCFGLTSLEAGSDAASMIDYGVVCEGEYQGQTVLGIRLNWHKRYITLGPIATVLGLAFKLYDPDGHLGRGEALGITLALVPTDLEGVEIGRRHLPAQQRFQNGPNRGRDVFIPLDHVIGGEEQVGHGWRMLMAALAAGRGISLPSLSASAAAFSARTAGAYARVREQFGIPIGKFEGIQNRLGRMAATAYEVDAARALTCAGLDLGHKPAVISAMMKAQATEMMRTSVNDAMDVHAGKAIMDGPRNYLGNLHRNAPIAITVEGANILTRNMIVFGQGSIRCHPHLLEEILALEDPDPRKALDAFDQAFWGHVAHLFKTLGRAWLYGWSGGAAAPVPATAARELRGPYKQLGRHAAAFTLLAEAALITLGGRVLRKEMLSARLGDILAKLYFLSAVLKRWEDDGAQRDDLPLVDYCMQEGFRLIEQRYEAVLRNLPSRPAAWLVRLFAMPFGARAPGASDACTRACATIVLDSSPTRDRLTAGLHPGNEGDAVHTLEKAFQAVIATAELAKRLKRAGLEVLEQAVSIGILSQDEADKLREAQSLTAEVLAVDDFSPVELAG